MKIDRRSSIRAPVEAVCQEPIVVDVMSDTSIDESVSDGNDSDDSVLDIRAIIHQLSQAIFARGEDLENRLHAILAPVVTDDDLYHALYVAALNGSVVAFRVPWGKLSLHGKQKYSKAATVDVFDFLHLAVNFGHVIGINNGGHLEVVRLLIQEYKWNINQINDKRKTPLCYACQHFDIARFLLENGANVNLGGLYGALWFAIDEDNTEVSRLLLVEYHANPNLNRRSADEEPDDGTHSPNTRNTDLAIKHGNEEILRMLLAHGAFLGENVIDAQNGTSLNILLCNPQKSRETKLNICRILMEHAANQGGRADHRDTATFLQASFEFAIKPMTTNKNEHCCILLEAGMDPRMSMYCAVRAENLSICQLLVHEYQVDPFLEVEEVPNEYNDGNETAASASAASPFLAAAQRVDTSLLEYFLGIWNDRFASTGGNKNSDGDCPLHVVCCDPHVSLQAIIVLINRQADDLAVIDGEQGLLPFRLAANCSASLDVIFYLLQHCPDALSHHGGNVVSEADAEVSSETNGMVETKGDDDKQQNVSRGPAEKKARTRHAI